MFGANSFSKKNCIHTKQKPQKRSEKHNRNHAPAYRKNFDVEKNLRYIFGARRLCANLKLP